MEEPGLDNRHRDKNGEISKKHGNTLISNTRIGQFVNCAA
jgi:hypothetical protein